MGFIFMLFSVIMLCVPKTDAAIVSDGDFESSAVLSSPLKWTAALPDWHPTPSLDGTALVSGIDPYPPSTYFQSLIGGGTTGGNISAVFVPSSLGTVIADSMASISQNVSTTPGKFYDIRLWVANMATTALGAPDTGARENLFSVIWNGAPIDLTHVSIVGREVFATPNPPGPLNPNPPAIELSGAAGTYVLAATGVWTLVIIPNQAASENSFTTLKISAVNSNPAGTAVDAVDVTETPEPSSIALLAAGAALAGLRRRRQQRAA